MNNIYAGFKLVVIFIFLGVLLTLFSKVQPQREFVEATEHEDD